MTRIAIATDLTRRSARWRRGLVACVLSIGLALSLLGAAAGPAHALKAIEINPTIDRVEITLLGDYYPASGDTLSIETAPAADGSTNRLSVPAETQGTRPNWFVFALRNPLDKPVERLLVADRYNLIGSGIIWPEIDARRLDKVTPSVGFIPDRLKSDRADIFRLTLEPGQTVTYAVELASDRSVRLYLWSAAEYEVRARDRQLFNGMMLGVTGLLAVFLTAVFAASHKVMFPAAAAFTWCVLAYLCVDFGFWHKLFGVRPEDNAQYRAAGEAAMAASLLWFVFVFLRVNYWHRLIRLVFVFWLGVQALLIAVAFVDPYLAATFARLSLGVIGVVSMALTAFLVLRGQDRALSLVPIWILFGVWLFGAALAASGRLTGEHVIVGLVSGLVLLVVLIGFTVTQYAFHSMEPSYDMAPDELRQRAKALDATGASVFQWSGRRNEIYVGHVMEQTLGLTAGELSTKVDDFVRHMYAADRERFLGQLQTLRERNSGNLHTEFRMRGADSHYRWFEIEAMSEATADRRGVSCVGLVRDITSAKHAAERLLHSSVHDGLTTLPNRELFLDRLRVAMARARTEPLVHPTVILIDIDRFKSVNSSYGLYIGDSLLVSVARKLAHHVSSPQDTLARIGGDQFAILLLKEQDPRQLANFADDLRRVLRSPIVIAGQEIVLTGTIGMAVYDGPSADPVELLRHAEIGLFRAKRGGSDRIELFKPEMLADKDARIAVESELRQAIDKGQLKLLYQPIIYLPTEELAGFEALVRWEHPKLGLLNPADFVPIAEESDLIVKLGAYVLRRAVQDAQRWNKEFRRPESPIFVSVNISSRQLFRPDLINEIRHIIGRSILPKGALRLEITETLVMDNPEQATAMLDQLALAGAGLSLDDFGTGYSSLSYLQSFPFDTIKVDRALVHGSAENTSGSTIMRSIVALAHELGKKVVAEGVEIDGDVNFLRSIGCEYAQGFLYGAPAGQREALQAVRSERRAANRRRGVGGLFRSRLRPVPAEAVADQPLATTNGKLSKLLMVKRAAKEADGVATNGVAKTAAPLKTVRLKPQPPPKVSPALPPAPQATVAPSPVAASVRPPAARPMSPPAPLPPSPPLMRQPPPPAPPAARMAPPTTVPPPMREPMPQRPVNLATLPPAIAASLARLAGSVSATDQSGPGGPPADAADPRRLQERRKPAAE